MKTQMTAFSLTALLALIGVSAWATSNVGVMPAIQELLAHPAAGFNPWFIATLFDAYFGFLWFWLWVAFKENSNRSRGAWLIAILLAGNMAMAVYVLLDLRRLPPAAGFKELLLFRRASAFKDR